MDNNEENRLGYFAVVPGTHHGELAVLVLGCPLGAYDRFDGRAQIAVAWNQEQVVVALRGLLMAARLERIDWNGEWHFWWRYQWQSVALPKWPALYLAAATPQEPKGSLVRVAAQAVQIEVENVRSVIRVPLNMARVKDLLIGLMTALGANLATLTGDGQLLLDEKVRQPS